MFKFHYQTTKMAETLPEVGMASDRRIGEDLVQVQLDRLKNVLCAL